MTYFASDSIQVYFGSHDRHLINSFKARTHFPCAIQPSHRNYFNYSVTRYGLNELKSKCFSSMDLARTTQKEPFNFKRVWDNTARSGSSDGGGLKEPFNDDSESLMYSLLICVELCRH